MFSAYLTWVLIFFLTPSVLLWLFYWRHLWKYRLIFIFIIACSIAMAFLWDFYAVRYSIWGWPEGCCSLARIHGSIPLDEVLWATFGAIYICTVTIVIRDILLTHRKLKRRI